MFDIVNRIVVIKECNNVNWEGEGKGGNNVADDFFKGGGCRSLVGVGVGWHGEF